MALLSFEDISFEDKEGKIIANFLRVFYAEIKKEDIRDIGDFEIKENSINFKGVSDFKANKQFNFLLSKTFKELKSKITGKPAVYVHQSSGIPLIGNVAFGIVDRNTSLIEIKPITGCNINCVFCSVDQSKRQADFVVEEGYMFNELKRLIEYKECDSIEVHIGTQGEPILYYPLIELIRDISSIKEVKNISIDTNGTMITKSKADEMIDAGLTQFNLSINSIDEKLAENIAGCKYDVKNVKELAEHISKSKAKLILTPVWIPGINDSEIPKIIEFAKKIGCRIGIQNFLNYRFGRNPAEQMKWEMFYDKLKAWEQEYGMKLILTENDFDITKTKKLEKPFKKDEVIKARVVCRGRLKDEMILAAKNRNITVAHCNENENKTIKIRITRDKHNIFYGELVSKR